MFSYIYLAILADGTETWLTEPELFELPVVSLKAIELVRYTQNIEEEKEWSSYTYDARTSPVSGWADRSMTFTSQPFQLDFMNPVIWIRGFAIFVTLNRSGE